MSHPQEHNSIRTFQNAVVVGMPEQAISFTGIIPNNHLMLCGLVTTCRDWSIIFFDTSRAIVENWFSVGKSRFIRRNSLASCRSISVLLEQIT